MIKVQNSPENTTSNNTPKKYNTNMKIYAYISETTLDTSDLNYPIKRQRPTGFIQKQNQFICCLLEIYHSFKDKDLVRVKE